MRTKLCAAHVMAGHRLDVSLEPLFDAASSVAFGPIAVTLGKRKPGVEFPCAEVLQVCISAMFNDDDVAAYIRFHNAFVMHRVKNNWPHRFALVYDVREFPAVRDWPQMVEHTLAFAMMHSDLGQHYKRWLSVSVVVLRDAETVARIRSIQAPFIDENTRPTVFRTESDGSLSDVLRRNGAVR